MDYFGSIKDAPHHRRAAPGRLRLLILGALTITFQIVMLHVYDPFQRKEKASVAAEQPRDIEVLPPPVEDQARALRELNSKRTLSRGARSRHF